MRFFSRHSDDPNADHLANLPRLVVARWVLLAGMALVVVIAPPLLDIPFARLPLFAVIGVGFAFNLAVAVRTRRAVTTGAGELFVQICFDIALFSAIIFFSGGATNPLVSLLLPPVAIAALTLPARHVAAVGALAVAAYSVLMIFYLPLPMADTARATHLHLTGMWLTFAVSTAMIAWFVVRMTRMIRQRDAELAAANEQALRDERMLALGTLAAGAAHELGTPLATMAVIAGELAQDAALPPAAREDATLLRQQIALCKEIISRLSQRAGADRLEAANPAPADRWLDTLRRRWQSQRPHVESHFHVAGHLPAPVMIADPTLEQAILNLLNNAANAAGHGLEMSIDWNPHWLMIEIRDHGPGFSDSVLDQAGQKAFPAHPGGSGIGLMLTRSAIERLGGRLRLTNHPAGGALARIELPLGLADNPKNRV